MRVDHLPSTVNPDQDGQSAFSDWFCGHCSGNEDTGDGNKVVSGMKIDHPTHLRNRQSSEAAGVVLCRLLYPYGETEADMFMPNEA